VTTPESLPVRIDRPRAAGLKYQGEPTRLVIGRRNIFREFVTINRGTRGGAAPRRSAIGTSSGLRHVAHDSTVGDQTIFGPHATLGGHVAVESHANISAGSAVHQFCRVGQHGFIGGYSVITKDALPFARTVGQPTGADLRRQHGGPDRRGFTPDVIAKLKRSFRYLLQSKLNTTRALQQIEQDQSLSCPEVHYLIDFIRSSQRGVILRRASRRVEEVVPTSSALWPQPSALIHETRPDRGQRPLPLSWCSTRPSTLGHEVTVVALKDETFPELADLAARHRPPPSTGFPSASWAA